MTHLSREELLHHARTWIGHWNRRDLDAVLAPFHEDAVFISPRAVAVTGQATVRGHAALRDYWTKALASVPELRFEPVAILCDEAAQTVLVHYVAHARGRSIRACEWMRFEDGRQVHGEALYGAEVTPAPLP